MLPSGDTIPSVGLGTWRASGEEVKKAVKVAVPVELPSQWGILTVIQVALNAGYRHIDCAWEYGVNHVHIAS